MKTRNDSEAYNSQMYNTVMTIPALLITIYSGTISKLDFDASIICKLNGTDFMYNHCPRREKSW